MNHRLKPLAIAGVVAVLIIAAIGVVLYRGSGGTACKTLEPQARFASPNSAMVRLLQCNGYPVSLVDDVSDVLGADGDRDLRNVTVFVPGDDIDASTRFRLEAQVGEENTRVVTFGESDQSGLGPVDVPDTSARFTPSGQHPVTDGVREVFSRTGAAFTSSEPGITPLLTRDNRVLLASDTTRVSGWYNLASLDAFDNQTLDQADNALLALRLAGAPGTKVVFIDFPMVSGVDDPVAEETGLSALPFGWKFALGALAIAVVLLAVARGRRLGPPDHPDRALPPRRAGYVDALAANLARTRDASGARAPLVAHARAGLRGAAGLATDADDDTIVQAALDRGLSEREATALRSDRPGSDTELILTARAVTRLNASRTKE